MFVIIDLKILLTDCKKTGIVVCFIFLNKKVKNF